MGQTLLGMRTLLVKETGKYHLVTDYENADYGDEGADFYINAGQRRIDDLFAFKKDACWFYNVLAIGKTLVTLPSARYVEEVWIEDRDSPRTRRKLTHKDEAWMRENYATLPDSANTSGDPLYWAPVTVGLPPNQYATHTARITAATQANPCVITCVAHGFSNADTVYINNVVGMTELNGNSYTVANKTADTFELSATDSSAYTEYVSGGNAATSADLAKVEDYDALIFGNHYLTTGVKIMPPPDTEITVETLAKVFSTELVNDTDVSFWSWNYPDVLLLAAKIEIEANIHVNYERVNAMNSVLLDKLKQIYYNLISEQRAGEPKEYRMI